MRIMTREMAIQVLEADYWTKVEELAAELRAIPAPAEPAVYPASEAFENRCREVLCETPRDAGFVLSLSRHTDDAGDNWHDVRDQAALAVALDAAELAGAKWLLDYHLTVPGEVSP